MKSITILAVGISMALNLTAQAQCTGNCENGFGAKIEGSTTSIGFFKEAKLDGLADVNGAGLYSGQWKAGKKDGFVVYNETGEFSFGYFTGDLKQGVHIKLLKDGGIAEEVFNKGISVKRNTVQKNNDPACLYGNCQDGVGERVETLPDGNKLYYTGKFANGLLEGPGYVRFSNSENQIYASFKGGLQHGIMLYVYPTGGVTLCEMKEGKRHGNLVNIFPDGRFAHQIFENGEPVKPNK